MRGGVYVISAHDVTRFSRVLKGLSLLRRDS